MGRGCRAPREEPEVPEEVEFQTKPEIALDQIRRRSRQTWTVALCWPMRLTGINTEFRDGLTELELQYVVGVQSSMTVWEPGKQPLPAKPRGKMGRPPRLLQRSTDHQPVSVKQLAMALPSTAFREITWREGRAEIAIALCRRSRTSGSSGLRESGPHHAGGMVADRMAARGERTHQILGIDAAVHYQAQSFDQDGQTPLDHRTGL